MEQARLRFMSNDNVLIAQVRGVSPARPYAMQDRRFDFQSISFIESENIVLVVRYVALGCFPTVDPVLCESLTESEIAFPALQCRQRFFVEQKT